MNLINRSIIEYQTQTEKQLRQSACILFMALNNDNKLNKDVLHQLVLFLSVLKENDLRYE